MGPGLRREALPKHQNGKLDVGVAGEVERHLLEGEKAVLRVIESALAALATEDAVRFPHPGEIGALPAQLVDQRAQRCIVEMSAAMGAEFGGHAAGAALPIPDQQARPGVEKDEPQQIALGNSAARAIEPT